VEVRIALYLSSTLLTVQFNRAENSRDPGEEEVNKSLYERVTRILRCVSCCCGLGVWGVVSSVCVCGGAATDSCSCNAWSFSALVVSALSSNGKKL
jgi:hypothetical protein